MHLLALVDPVDDTYRRLMNRQLTVQESRHRLARSTCHGGRGQIRQACCEGQEKPARRPRPGPQRRGPVEHPLPGRGHRPAPRRGPGDQG
nr:Tn3 family transposase [Streptomyces hydrogenans]